MVKEKIFATSVSTGTYQEFLEEIIKLTEYKTSSYVCFANVHAVVEAYKDKIFSRIINNADIVAPDGKPLSLFLQFFKNKKQERVCGMDLLPDLLKQAEQDGKSIYLYGSTRRVLKRIVKRASKEFPRLNICGVYSPPFRRLRSKESDRITQMINKADPDLLFVSLGCPKQEKWMAEHKGKINACMLGLGQAFNVYARTEKRLPKWMRSLCLEWAYRLYLEPKRLWKRYLYTNSLFLILVLKQAVKALLRPRSLSVAKTKQKPNFLNQIKQ